MSIKRDILVVLERCDKTGKSTIWCTNVYECIRREYLMLIFLIIK